MIVARNLLDNVASNGEVISREDSAAARVMIRFWVRDNGPGLTADEQARLFAPFQRLHQAQVEGHGLGLSIVQRIVAKLEGQAGVTSEPGQGSTFYFTLPMASSNGKG